MRWKTGEYSGWGRVLKADGDRARPEKLSDLKAILREGGLPAIGNLRSYGDAALNSGGRAVDMTRLDRLRAFDPETGILEAEAGVTIGEILRLFLPKGWIPAVMPGTGFATLGGCIGHDVHGKNHHVAGSFGQHVTRIDLLGANGRVRRITPEGNPDLFRATIGGMGQTGIILSAAIRMIPATSPLMDLRESRIDTLAEFMTMLDASTATYCVGWIDATAKGATLGRGILEEAEIGSHGQMPKAPRHKSVPFNAPGFLLSSPVVRAFNHLYFRRVPVGGRRLDRAMADFFFPLDKVHNWNRLYGKSGFHQFQCVLPEAPAREALAKMLEQIARSRLASPLAVLKKLGPGRAGMMSFPMEGFTLAVDFPNRPASAGLIRELGDIAADAGGRIYLAKDALASPATIAGMYDEREAFAAAANAVDPAHALETDLTRRLKLRDAT
ncbi:MAG: FAD-binding oxidoreductase [Rhodobacteraceae bacterium]|nr:FAD-binding oxidoreductase [Paracoccaceae bacterium]